MIEATRDLCSIDWRDDRSRLLFTREARQRKSSQGRWGNDSLHSKEKGNLVSCSGWSEAIPGYCEGIFLHEQAKRKDVHGRRKPL